MSISEALEKKRKLTNAIKTVKISVMDFWDFLDRALKDIGAAYDQKTQLISNKIWYQSIHSHKLNTCKTHYPPFKTDTFLSN